MNFRFGKTSESTEIVYFVFEGTLEQGNFSALCFYPESRKEIKRRRHFIELNGKPHFTFEFCRALSAERTLNSLISIPNHVLVNLLHKIP